MCNISYRSHVKEVAENLPILSLFFQCFHLTLALHFFSFLTKWLKTSAANVEKTASDGICGVPVLGVEMAVRWAHEVPCLLKFGLFVFFCRYFRSDCIKKIHL